MPKIESTRKIRLDEHYIKSTRHAMNTTRKILNDMQNVNKIEAIQGKGLQHDRKFKENNLKHCQITLIVSS